MNIKSNKGFSLIELMVTVGIIGIITMIAVPNFQKFQAKAKQTNARTELSSVYGMQKAFFTEYGHFHVNLHLVGYVPDGYPTVSASNTCPVGITVRASAATGGVRYYDVGFRAAGTGDAGVDDAPTGMTTVPCAGISEYLATVDPATSAPSGSSGAWNNASTASNSAFIISANGSVLAGKKDVWTMNTNKSLTNTVVGL